MITYKNIQKNHQIQTQKIMQTQIQLLSIRGPPLGLFTSHHSNELPFIIQDSSPQKHIFKFKTDINTNFRVFYYFLLYYIYQIETQIFPNLMLILFKTIAFNQNNKLDDHPINQIPLKFQQFYNDATLKKLLVQFLQVLSYSQQKGRVIKMLARYPIMDFILSLVIKKQIYKMNNRKQQNNMDINIFIKWFKQIFQIQIIMINKNEIYFPKAKYMVQRGAEYTKIFEQNLVIQKKQYVPEKSIFIPNFNMLSSYEQLSTQQNTPQFKILITNRNRKQSNFQILKDQNQQIYQQIEDFQSSSKRNSKEQNKNLTFSTFSNNFYLPKKDQKTNDQTECYKQQIEKQKHQKIQVKCDNINEDKKCQETKIKQMQLYDGLTSTDILKFMSDNVKKLIDNHKKKSLEDILGKSTIQSPKKKTNGFQQFKRSKDQSKQIKLQFKKQIQTILDELKLPKYIKKHSNQTNITRHQHKKINPNNSLQNLIKPQSSKIYLQKDHQNKQYPKNYFYQKSNISTYSPVSRLSMTNIPFNSGNSTKNHLDQIKYFPKKKIDNMQIERTSLPGNIGYYKKFAQYKNKYKQIQINTNLLRNHEGLRYTQGNLTFKQCKN